MEEKAYGRSLVLLGAGFPFWVRFLLVGFEIAVLLIGSGGNNVISENDGLLHLQAPECGGRVNYLSHSCIHDQILHQRRHPGLKEYLVMPQVYDESDLLLSCHQRRRALLSFSSPPENDVKQPIRIYLNYDAVGHSPFRDCRSVEDIVKLGEPPTSLLGTPVCNPHGDPPFYGNCWYNCTLEDVSWEDKKQRLRKALDKLHIGSREL